MVNSGACKAPRLAIAEDPGEGEDARLAGGEQFLHGEFRRGVEIPLEPSAAGRDQLGREGMQMGLVSGRDLQRRRLDLDEASGVEPAAERRHDPVPREQERPPVGVAAGRPERRGGSHADGKRLPTKTLAEGGKVANVRAD